jgi:2-polyprenyl-3-methyl-5-hydroxy-6-metoxy-1,4-benzoquinol methylase
MNHRDDRDGLGKSESGPWEDRKQKEIEHSDRRRQIVTGYEYQTDASRDDLRREFIKDQKEYEKHFSNIKFYSITRSSFAYRDSLVYEDIQGKTVLDYCCGNGEVGVAMAARGAGRVHGIDISQVAADNATRLAQVEGLEDQCCFEVRDAEDTQFEDNMFDLVHEYGALHHLDLEAAFKETSRILKPQGRMVCSEALRHNPLIHMYRKRTMHLRTEWEVDHILGVPEILIGREYFQDVKVRFFHLAALAAIPFRKRGIFSALLGGLELVDNALLRIPYFQRLAWVAVIEYRNPRK